ncbi:hypothetical protein CJF32_00009617 [Rutstroemia sp. NJR-2017a WRK4]|nr:hypothetical protein CJF32_00009617 [Rutstroemia sp. NJR-2017a WRK4]
MQKIDEAFRRTARSRTPTACLQCQKRKQRCSREQPCRHCSRRYPPVECIYTSDGLSVPEPSYYTDLDLQDNQSASPQVSQGYPFAKQVYSYGQDLEQIGSGTTYSNTSLAPVIEFTPFPSSQPQYHPAMPSNESPPNTSTYNTDFDSPESSRLSSESSNQTLSYDFMSVRDLETSTWDSGATAAMSDMPLFDNFTAMSGNSRGFAYSGPQVYDATPAVGSNDAGASYAGQGYATGYARGDGMAQQVPSTSGGYSEQSRVYYYDQ